jgi:hypothetical protein
MFGELPLGNRESLFEVCMTRSVHFPEVGLRVLRSELVRLHENVEKLLEDDEANDA